MLGLDGWQKADLSKIETGNLKSGAE